MKEEERQQLNNERKKMRARIIHLLCLMGYVNQEGQPDYERINAFVQSIGKNNPRKVILNYLWKDELQVVTTQVEQMYKNEVARFNNK